MDAAGIDVALTSLAQPGVQFGDPAKAPALARRCNEYASELSRALAQALRRVGGRADGGTWTRRSAEIDHALGELKHQGVCLFASYGEKFLGDAHFDPVLDALNARDAVVFVHPALHPSSRKLALPWPGFMMEYVFDTTRAAVNLVFTGAIERFPRIRFVLAHAGGLMPYFAWRLSISPMIDARLEQLSPDGGLRPAQALLVRQCAVADRRDDGLPCGRRVARPYRVRQRLAVRQRARDRGGGQDLRGGRRCRRRSGTRSTAATRCRFSRNSPDGMIAAER